VADVAVVGARCAGSAVALLLARRGHRVLLVDRARFPSDTLSGHMLHHNGAAVLARWGDGLLDAVAASGCPAIRRHHIDFGGSRFVARLTPQEPGDPAAGYCVRRTVLDKLLLDAAARAGAEVREGFAVTELVRDGARVVGLRGRERAGEAGGADGPLVEERARVVIGADGKRSLIARLVAARSYFEEPARTALYYSYWSGVPTDQMEVYWVGGPGRPRAGGSCDHVVTLMPTNAGLTQVAVIIPAAQFRSFKADVEASFLRLVDASPVRERVRAGRREERFSGTGDLGGFFRQCAGPGWALVGDAGFFKDPILGHGMSDAFLHAESLATAVDEGLSGAAPLDGALERYARRRDPAARPSYDLTNQFARLYIDDTMAAVVEALGRPAAAADAERFWRAVFGSHAIDSFFSPASIARITGGRAEGGPHP
jgi:flavin-dependent dehydrogenase